MGNSNSGRHKYPETVAKECRIAFEGKAVELWNALLEKAAGGSLDALVYVFDRQWGRPKAELDMRIKQTLSFSPDELALMSQVTISEIPALALTVASDQIEASDNDNQSMDEV